MLYEDITAKIIKAYYQVYNDLGYGFLEKVYENAMVLELKNQGLQAVTQEVVKVYYKNSVVGEYFADIMVNGNIILELKAVDNIHGEHIRQIKNYLKATGIETGLLFNFGKKAEFKRIFLKGTSTNCVFLPIRFKNPNIFRYGMAKKLLFGSAFNNPSNNSDES